MAVTHRTATRALSAHKQLQEKPYEFDFYWAMRLLECIHPESPRIGESVRPADESVRFGQEASTSFAPSSISAFTPREDGRKPRIEVLLFGLFGPNGPLPLHLTEYAKDRLHNADDPTFSRFVDLFHHRMLSLFYRAWANAQPAVNFDRPEEDRFETYLGATCGLGMPSLKGRDAMPDLAKLHFAGWFSCQTRNADGLEAIVADFFKLPVNVEQFVGNWMELPVDGLCRLGESRDTGTLGTTAIIGERVWGRIFEQALARLAPGGRLVWTSYFDREHRMAARLVREAGGTVVGHWRNPHSRALPTEGKSMDRWVGAATR